MLHGSVNMGKLSFDVDGARASIGKMNLLSRLRIFDALLCPFSEPPAVVERTQREVEKERETAERRIARDGNVIDCWGDSREEDSGEAQTRS